MILIEMSGGLGNQMFQYALYRRMLSLGKEVYLDTSYYRSGERLREFELAQLSLPMQIMSDAEVNRCRGYGYQTSFAEKVALRLRGTRLTAYQDQLEYYQPQIFEMEDVYLQGYWQSEQYFREIADEIRLAYDIHPTPGPVKQECLDYIQNADRVTVSLHVRLGDYVEPQNARVYGGICTEAYYRNAVAHIREHVENPLFVVFSDNMEQAMQMIRGEDVYYVRSEENGSSLTDMYLMSQCRHHIIANSTYSWWGAWLTETVDTIVVAPERWFANHEHSDVICDRWVHMSIH